MDEIYRICKSAMMCIVSDNYTLLEQKGALTRVSENDIRRVLAEYNPNELPVMPPDDYFESTAYVIQYKDGSGCHIDIDLCYPSGRSDLTLQLDVRKRDAQLCFVIDDLRVL